MVWLAVSLFGYFLNGVSILVNKMLLGGALPRPAAYAFWSSALGAVVLLFLPFVGVPPAASLTLISFAAGALFVFALLSFYTALQRGEASRVAPLVGGLVPIFVLMFAYPVLGEAFKGREWWSFLLILAGGVLVSGGKGGKRNEGFFLGVLAALLFAASHVLSKFVYVHYAFLGGLVWRTIGSLLAGLLLILIPWSRGQITQTLHRPRRSAGVLFLFGHAMGALSFVLVNYAFTLGSVALVNALSGTQYVFIFLAAIFLSRRFPQILEENITPRVLVRKTASIALISGGIALLFLS